MKSIFNIAWRDLRVLLTSPMFFFIAFLCTAFWSFMYLRHLVLFAAQSMGMLGAMGQEPMANIHYSVFVSHISYANLVLIFCVPALTMRLISEEKKTRTYDLLMTAPITATDIAIGKFLAGLGAVTSLILISFIYPLGTRLIADFHFGPLLTSYLGLLLIAGCYVAAGLLASSLTESVVLSVVMGLIFNLALWFVSQGVDMSDAPMFVAVMEHLSIGQQFMTFIRGTIQIGALVFFLSCMALFVFLAQRVIESSRWR